MSDNVVVAETHPPEYLLHKYWSRKPHNVLSSYVAQLVGTDRGLVVDPFCGSGVLLREAALLGHDVIGADVNPVAVNLSSVTVDPPALCAFREAAELLLDTLRSLTDRAYATSAEFGGHVRYVVHATVARCVECDRHISAAQAPKSGRTYLCPYCAHRIRFNLKSLVDTCPIEVVLAKGIVTDTDSLAEQERLSGAPVVDAPSSKFDFPFVENKRTLTYAGMTTSALFTKRNWSIITRLAEVSMDYHDEQVRAALQLLLTGSVAQCSRLIAYRGRMSGGGPAWSVPGFWVPPIHLETNPLVHIKARIGKFERGLRALHLSEVRTRPRVVRRDAEGILKDLARSERKADLVFLDPPYGDSVPYLEFSALWNSFLGELPDLVDDMSVSNRSTQPSDWTDYQANLDAVLAAAKRGLRDGGTLLVTFNGHDHRSWVALVSGLQKHGFTCEGVTYQIPAVVSAKAQFSPQNSYLGDLYCVYRVTARDILSFAAAEESMCEALRRCASSRRGRIAYNLGWRTIVVECMKLNVSSEGLHAMDDLISRYFSRTDGVLVWRGPLDERVRTIDEICVDAMLDGAGGRRWPDVYRRVASKMITSGVPDASEIKLVIDSISARRLGNHRSQLTLPVA